MARKSDHNVTSEQLIPGPGLEESARRLKECGTEFTLPDSLSWVGQPEFPERSLDNAVLEGSLTDSGTYLTIVRWHPGYMSAPHTYATDRICVVLAGVWWINCGTEFDPNNCVPVPAGSFVRRAAHTPHYDGVIAQANEPAVIAICGMAPVEVKLVDPAQPGWRQI